MRAKDIIPASKPRNFVAKNQKTAGAGAHKDKKKAEKQGDVKHKNKFNYKQDDWSQDFERRMKGEAMEGRHGYDDAGFSLAPGHDEGEPVYNPRYDRTGSYDRKSKYSQDYDYNTGKPLDAASQKKGFIFYNVNDPQTAQKLGLKQTKSGKWYLPTGSTFLQKTADKVFGPGKVWYPKD